MKGFLDRLDKITLQWAIFGCYGGALLLLITGILSAFGVGTLPDVATVEIMKDSAILYLVAVLFETHRDVKELKKGKE